MRYVMRMLVRMEHVAGAGAGGGGDGGRAAVLVRLADRLDVDLTAAAERKLRANAEKYPVEKAWGKSTKYTEL